MVGSDHSFKPQEGIGIDLSLFKVVSTDDCEKRDYTEHCDDKFIPAYFLGLKHSGSRNKDSYQSEPKFEQNPGS